MKNKFLYIVFFFVSSSSFSQSSVYIAFVDVLKKWEKTYQVSFSFSDEDLVHIYIPKKIAKLQAIDFNRFEISPSFPFEFKVLPKNIIAIVPKLNFKKCHFQTLDFESNNSVKSEIFFPNFKISNQEDAWFHVLLPKSLDEVLITASSYVEYRLMLDVVDLTTPKQLFLIPSNIELSEVLVTNYITKGIAMNIRGDLVLSPNEFGVLPGQIEADVLQSIQLIPGIISAEESVSYINVRGGTHDQNLFLVDGIKKYQTAHFFGMISAFNPYMIATTTLTKNGTSSSYGESVSSVIELKSSEQINDSLRVQLGGNLISTDVFIDAPIRKDMSFQLATRRSITDFFKTPTYQRFYDKVFQNTSISSSAFSANDTDEFSFLDTSFRFNYKPTEKDYLRFNFSYLSNDFTIQQATESFPLSFERESSLRQEDIGVGLFYKRKHSSTWNSSIQYYYTDYAFSGFNIDLNNNQSLLQKNALEEYGVKLGTNYKWNTHWQLRAGIQLNETSVTNLEEVNNPLFFRSIQEAILSTAGFSSLTYNNSQSGTFIDVGVRANHYSKFDQWYVEPRLSLSQRLFDKFTLQLKAEQKSQITSQIVDLQTDFLGVESRRWVLANETNIPVINSTQYSAGLQYRKRNFLASVEFFIKEVDGITSQSQGFLNQFQFSQTHGSYSVKGFDFLLNQQFNEVTAWLNYSFADNNYSFRELFEVDFRHNLDITHVVSAGINYTLNDWKFSTGFNWHSGVPTTPIIAERFSNGNQQVNFGHPNQANLPIYLRWDASVNYKFSIGNNMNAVSGVSFWNMLNRSNVFNRFYNLNDNGTMVEVDQLALKFTPNLMFRIIW